MISELRITLPYYSDFNALENLSALDDQKLKELWEKYEFAEKVAEGILEPIRSFKRFKGCIRGSKATIIICSLRKGTCLDPEAQTSHGKSNGRLTRLTSGKCWIMLSLLIAVLFTSAVLALSIVIIQGDAPAMTSEMEAGSIFTLAILGLATFALFMVACTMKLWKFLGLLSLGYVSLLAAGLMAHLF